MTANISDLFVVVDELVATVNETGEVELERVVPTVEVESEVKAIDNPASEIEQLQARIAELEAANEIKAGIIDRKERLVELIKDQHEAYKIKISTGAHRQARIHSYCKEFDDFMANENLPRRVTRTKARMIKHDVKVFECEIEVDQVLGEDHESIDRIARRMDEAGELAWVEREFTSQELRMMDRDGGQLYVFTKPHMKETIDEMAVYPDGTTGSVDGRRINRDPRTQSLGDVSGRDLDEDDDDSDDDS
jgi:KaiC/GvpD/RAD55 family RecA-like ATPase